MGSSFFVIIGLLSKVFIKLILLSISIASSISWFSMNGWLRGYAYRIEIVLWMFILVGVVVMLIGLATVSFQAVKATVANPVKSLRIA